MANGCEIQLNVWSGGSWLYIAELSEVDYDADQSLEAISVLGSRRVGYRRGQYKVSGTIKGYWINGALRAMYLGATAPTESGSASAIYHSSAPFNRYNIEVVPTSVYGGAVAPPLLTFVNVTLGKDTIQWQPDKATTESITFNAEDIIGE